MEWIMIALGGGIGATIRYSVTLLLKHIDLESYWSTVMVNIVGSFFLGVAMNVALIDQSILSFITIGILGAFTTFSTFAFDLVKLIESKRMILFLVYSLMNLVGGLMLFVLGYYIVWI